ncbi:hypothetical protein LWI28_023858 [Acer negundo]|uniref:Uncharacterized protein n=1 Tax=Acer negundo TaxID=4023 RepID=A0AAD5IKF3_ACENE|nr:hypothetical protein LWI28_023858 [Acer negundo]
MKTKPVRRKEMQTQTQTKTKAEGDEDEDWYPNSIVIGAMDWVSSSVARRRGGSGSNHWRDEGRVNLARGGQMRGGSRRPNEG